MSLSTMNAKRRGFTLFELLVVIAILAMLMGLMVQGIQGAREMARQLSCRNNLAQMGKAININAAGQMRGGDSSFVRMSSNSMHTGFSWLAQILPQMEEINTYNNLTAGTPANKVTTGTVSANTATQTKLAWTTCATYSASETPTEGASTYRGNAGVYNSGSFNPEANSNSSGPGAFSFAKNVRNGEFLDGLSKTVLVSESRQAFIAAGSPCRWAYGELWHPAAVSASKSGNVWGSSGTGGGSSGFTLLARMNDASFTITNPPPTVNVTASVTSGTGTLANTPPGGLNWGPSSMHPNKAISHVFGDGSVQMIMADNVDEAVYAAICTRNGNENSHDWNKD